jgi:transposase-like protein
MSHPSTRPTLYKGYRFPPEIISRCVWLYYRFGVSLRDVSELMLARGIEISHEAIRLWTLRFGTENARRLRRTSRDAAQNPRKRGPKPEVKPPFLTDPDEESPR